jgi:hypothetical protein
VFVEQTDDAEQADRQSKEHKNQTATHGASQGQAEHADKESEQSHEKSNKDDHVGCPQFSAFSSGFALRNAATEPANKAIVTM